MPLNHRTAKSALVLVALTAVQAPSVAQADVKAECVQAATRAQNLRNAHKLIESRAALLVCARRQCPGAVRSDCTRWLSEVDQSLPTIVPGAKNASGSDVANASLTIDGTPAPQALNGEAVPIDPGQHVLRFAAPGSVPVSRTVVIRQGEKNREISVVLVSAAKSEQTKSAATSPAPPVASTKARAAPPGAAREQRPGSKWSSQRTWALVAGGAGVAGAVVGTVFAIRAESKWNDAKQACGTGCGPGSQAYALNDQSKQARTVAIVAFAVGGAALAAGAVLWFTAPHPKEGPSVSARIGLGRFSINGSF